MGYQATANLHSSQKLKLTEVPIVDILTDHFSSELLGDEDQTSAAHCCEVQVGKAGQCTQQIWGAVLPIHSGKASLSQCRLNLQKQHVAATIVHTRKQGEDLRAVCPAADVHRGRRTEAQRPCL